MSPRSSDIGREGEQIAVDYLLSIGYEVVERNFRIDHLEVDIIGYDGNTLCFVEVKTRSSSERASDDFMPEKAMTAAKQERITRAAQSYLEQRSHTGEISIELIAINLSPTSHTLRHYRNLQWG